MTSYPCSTRRAAATELSTPPDIATRTRLRTPEHHRELADLLHDLREDLRHPGDVGGGALMAEGEAEGAQRDLARDAHGLHDMRWLDRAGGTGAPARGAHSREVEVHQQRLAVGAGDREAQDMR